jgi:glutathione S-transferase
MSANDKPVLWHIPVSHYSEKVRWALDYKGIDAERRAPMPGGHMVVALWHTRGAGKTFPMLRLDGRLLADSSAIIEALERYQPEPALYPADPAERRRALELEEFFDEELGPYMRLLGWHELLGDPDRMGQVTASMLPGPLTRVPGAERMGRGVGGAFTRLRYRVADEDAAAAARLKITAAMDRLDAELEAVDGDHLAGDRFSVADLTAAALFYPLVLPPEAPQELPNDPPAGMARFREPLMERPGYDWVRRTFAAYRRAPQPVAA